MTVKLANGQNRVLTAEMLADIRRKLRADPEKSADHRSEPRVGFRASVDITPYVAGVPAESCDAWIIDLSGSGISILSRSQLKESQQFMIELPYQRTKFTTSLAVLCIVANCDPLPDGIDRIGCTFG